MPPTSPPRTIFLKSLLSRYARPGHRAKSFCHFPRRLTSSSSYFFCVCSRSLFHRQGGYDGQRRRGTWTGGTRGHGVFNGDAERGEPRTRAGLLRADTRTHARTQQTHLPGRIGLPINFALQFEAVCVPVRGRLRLMLACVCVRARMPARVSVLVPGRLCGGAGANCALPARARSW
jgi:hypothetical protein